MHSSDAYGALQKKKVEKSDALTITVTEPGITCLSGERINEIISTIYTQFGTDSVEVEVSPLPLVTLSGDDPDGVFRALSYFEQKLKECQGGAS